ncbi:MAG TPA: response regulator [Anaerolineae bacterium]|nr:response regulator [Anaerolineae bacterium]HQK13942.1 response regulator [Anaerolineae bacterium]
MSKDGAPRHILIVEDDPNTAEMLSAYFSSVGYQVSHAAWGQDALKIATETLPDLVVLDIHLPDIDGYEVCMALRSQRRTEHTPIIFLTERRERMDRLTGLQLGAVDYITKPFDVQELRFRVRNVLRRSNLDTFLDPITSLPTSMLVEEQVERIITDGNLSLIGVALLGMPAFCDAYGFVAHDDVLRAVALILRNTATEIVSTDPFVGQLDTYQFIVLAPAGQDGYVALGRLSQRLNEAISFFYPHIDWERGVCSDGSPLPKINFDIRLLTSDQLSRGGDLSQLRQALFGKKKQG